jgi:DNA adenine methylase
MTGSLSLSLSAFPYVGGKTTLSDWVIGQLPGHEVYVEPFGGSAAMLLNKDRSNVEVYNDLDGDIVQFFTVARDRPDDLVEWVRRTPFSEELHQRYVQAFYNGDRPDDAIERAGRFLFLRYTQFAGKYNGPSGFKRDTPRSRAGESTSWQNAPEKIRAVCQRLQGVSIQRADYADIIGRYDGPTTVFYCDPPYLDKEHTYRVDDFQHTNLADALADIDGYAMVSYATRPDGLYADWTVVTRQHGHDAGNRTGNTKEVTERLLCNFDPAAEPEFTDAAQTTLGDISVATDGGTNPNEEDGGR